MTGQLSSRVRRGGSAVVAMSIAFALIGGSPAIAATTDPSLPVDSTAPDASTSAPADPTPSGSDPVATDPAPSDPAATAPAATSTAYPSATPVPDGGAIPTVDPAATLPPVAGAPTWAEVSQAAGDPAASAPLMSQISAQLAALQAQLDAAKAAATQAGADYDAAKQQATERRNDVDSLEQQITEAEGRADASGEAMSTMALYLRNRSGGLDPQLVTFFGANGSSDYLDRATTLNRFSDNTDALVAQAEADAAALEQLKADAEVALADAEALEAAAQAKRDAAVAAQQALESQQTAALQASAQLDGMLGVLQDGRTPTQGDLSAILAAQQAAYQAGLDALAAAGVANPNGLGAVAPLSGMSLTDVYGPRPNLGKGFHDGIDLVAAGGTMGAPIYAVMGGVVTYAGPMGTLGNVVVIDLGNGTTNMYAHIQDGGIGVKLGQQITAGQPIALAGSTGLSTGAHLHFQVEVGGRSIDPLPWLAALGIQPK